jgi:energy-coupling factor transport system permease protein
MANLALNVQARPTPLGDIDVRVKFALLVSVSFLIFVWNSLALQATALAAMVALLLAAGVRAGEIARLAAMLWPAFALIVLIQGLWSPLGVTPVWHLPAGVPWLGGAVLFRWEGLAFGLTVCCRLLIPLLAFLFLFATSSPNRIVLGLVRMRVPYRVAFLVSTTFRFVPLLLEELSAMRDAQRLRGIDIDAMGLGRRLVLNGRMLVPLIVASLRRAQQIEVALQARGFSGSERRSYLDAGRERLRPAEAAAIVALLALPPAAALLRAATGLGSAVI